MRREEQDMSVYESWVGEGREARTTNSLLLQGGSEAVALKQVGTEHGS